MKKIIALFTVLKIVHTTFWWDDLYKRSWPKLSKNHTKKKPYKNILTYHIGYVTVKDLHYSTVNNVNPLYLIMRKVESVSTDESKGTLGNMKAYGTKSEILLD